MEKLCSTLCNTYSFTHSLTLVTMILFSYYLLFYFIFSLHIACPETLSVSFNVLKGEEEDGKWSSELVFLDLIDVKGSIQRNEDAEEGADGGGKGKDADDLFYVIGMEMKQPLEMVIQGFLRFELRNGTFVNDLKSSNGIQLHSHGSFERTQDDDSGAEAGFKVKIHSKLTTRDQIEVTYDLQLEKRAICPRVVLNHSLTSIPPGLVTFQSEAIETCHASSSESDAPSSHLIINMILQSQILPILNTKLDQIFVFRDDRSGWESMNATNPAVDIQVKADWNQDVHTKTAFINGKLFNIPSFGVEYNKNDGYSFLVKSAKRIKFTNDHEEL